MEWLVGAVTGSFPEPSQNSGLRRRQALYLFPSFLFNYYYFFLVKCCIIKQKLQRSKSLQTQSGRQSESRADAKDFHVSRGVLGLRGQCGGDMWSSQWDTWTCRGLERQCLCVCPGPVVGMGWKWGGGGDDHHVGGGTQDLVGGLPGGSGILFSKLIRI